MALSGLSESATSPQLRLSPTAGLVSYRKEGRIAYYRLPLTSDMNVASAHLMIDETTDPHPITRPVGVAASALVPVLLPADLIAGRVTSDAPTCLACTVWYSGVVLISKKFDTMKFEQSAALLGALSDPIRLAILDLLSNTPKCACEIGDDVEIAPNLLSYHLKVLREAGLIVGEKRGRWIDYSIAPDAWQTLRKALPVEYHEARR